MPTVHVIGAGLAGLSAAADLSSAGRTVVLYEAAPVAGGRCRSYFDRELGCRVDNGNHLVLSGNRAALAFLERVGGRASLHGPATPEFAFMDATTGARWTVRPSRGRVPWWILSPSRRVPGTSWRDYLDLARLSRAAPSATVAAALRPGPLFTRLLEPLAVAALNTPPDEAAASLLRGVVAETLLKGGQACIPLLPKVGLSESFVDPTLSWLAKRGVEQRFGRRVAALRTSGGRVATLQSPDGPVTLEDGDQVVLAVPPSAAQNLLPGLTAPDAFQTIVNVHFRIEAPDDVPAFIGIIGGTAEWVFAKPGHLSVTISAANRLADQPAESLAAAVWPDVRAAYKLPAPMPVWRVVKERRATFAATVEQDRRRPSSRTGLSNLFLAGDWTATGLPATIEGAIRSGSTAAQAVLAGG